MGKGSEKEKPQSGPWLTGDIARAISELDRRIKDLEDFDVKTIAKRFDFETKALEDKINETLSDIFGQNSVEFRKNSILTLDTLPIALGEPEYPPSRLQQAYQKGINNCVTKLKSLKETLERKPPETK